MDEFLKMDIFFVVTTVAVVVVTILLAFVLIRVLRILKNLDELSAMAHEEGELLREDLKHVREGIYSEGFKVKHLLGFLGAAKRRRAKKSER